LDLKQAHYDKHFAGGTVETENSPVMQKVIHSSDENDGGVSRPKALDRAKHTILLIDDDPSCLQVSELVLANVGFSVLTAATGVEAMAVFQTQHIDAVVTDHLKGRLSTLKLAASMKRLKPHVPILSFSGSGDSPKSRSYADRCIAKAEGPETLIAAIDQILTERTSKLALARPLRLSLPPLALLAAIVEDSTDAILSKTLDGVITSWNHSAELMYGYTREEAVGAPVAMLLPEDRHDEVKRLLIRIAHGERITNFETVRVSKTGRRINVMLTISPIRDGRGRIVGASTIARDITELRRTEEALRKAERLATTGRMAATLAHEIKNPLDTIGNILYLLRSVALSEEARKYIEIATNELERASEISQLTLGMQRGSSKNTVPLLVTNLIENVLSLYCVRTRELGIKVVRKYGDKGMLIGFPVELQQVFSNLIVNAIDAMSSVGDKLILSVRRSRSPETGERGVRISVLDNGPGISPEHGGRLFEPFYTTKGEEGTGIGLWVSRSIVQKHGGTLRVHSSVRKGRSGTCFSVFLPLHLDTLTKAA
jgi:PAS domain S-box-containing protein